VNCELRLEIEKVSVLNKLYDMLVESLNELGFSVSERLTAYALIRTFTPIKTIKAISEDILGINRTTLIKNIQRLAETEDLLYNQLSMFPDILDGRKTITAIIDSTFIKRFSENVYSAKLRWNHAKRCYEILQEQINCCLFTDIGVYTVYTLIKPEDRKSTEIYSHVIDYVSKKTSGRLQVIAW